MTVAKSACGNLNVTTGTSAVAVTGLGFQPNVIIFFWTGRTASSNGVRATSLSGFGWATGNSSNFSRSTYDGDALATAVAKNNIATDSCIIELDNTGAIVGKAALTSFDSDGFTITPSDAFVTDLLVSWQAFAVTQAESGITAWPAVTGNLAVTNSGNFQPDITLFAIGSQLGSGADATLMLGAATGASNQGVLFAGNNDVSGIASAGSYCLSSECIANHQAAALTSPTARAQFVSNDSSGFTINVIERNAASPSFAWLSIKGGAWSVGNLLTRTDGNPITKTGLGFVPVGILFASAGNAETTADATPATHAKWSIGAAAGNSNRIVQQYGSRSGQTDMYVFGAARSDAVCINTDPNQSTYTLTGLMDLTSFDSDGFSCVMDDTDPSAAFVFFIAVGNPPVSVTPDIATLTLTTFAPTVLTPSLITPDPVALTLTTFAPTVSTSNPQTIIPSTHHLILTTYAPTVTCTTAAWTPGRAASRSGRSGWPRVRL